jgi:hypothetical protein
VFAAGHKQCLLLGRKYEYAPQAAMIAVAWVEWDRPPPISHLST